jgi:hypothetical protein
MPFGFFTIERWHSKKQQWVPVCHLNADGSITKALEELERRGRPGFFRVVQMQRMVKAEKKDGKLRLRKWHAGTPQTLARAAAGFDRESEKRLGRG